MVLEKGGCLGVVQEGCAGLRGPGRMCLCGTEKQQPTLTGDQHPGACLLPKTALCHRLILTDTAPVVAIPAVAWRVPALPRGCPQGIPGVLSRVYPGGIPELSRLYPGMSRHCADHASMAPPGAAAGRGGLAGRLSRVI